MEQSKQKEMLNFLIEKRKQDKLNREENHILIDLLIYDLLKMRLGKQKIN